MTERLEKIAHALFDLETPVRKALHLANALRMMASGDALRGESGDAVETLAQSLVEILRQIERTRDKTCCSARMEANGRQLRRILDANAEKADKRKPAQSKTGATRLCIVPPSDGGSAA